MLETTVYRLFWFKIFEPGVLHGMESMVILLAAQRFLAQNLACKPVTPHHALCRARLFDVPCLGSPPIASGQQKTVATSGRVMLGRCVCV